MLDLLVPGLMIVLCIYAMAKKQAVYPALLSGGLDSSLVCAIAARKLK